MHTHPHIHESGRVHSFEPNSETVNILKKNAELAKFQNIEVYECGLGSISELRKLVYFVGDKNRGAVRLDPREKNDDERVLQIKTLDAFNFDSVDFLKIDVEGMEVVVLEGAENTIETNRPLIFLEVNALDSVVPIFDWAKIRRYKIFGLIAAAYNPNNFNDEPKNIFGAARESGILLIPENSKAANFYFEQLQELELPEIQTADDLVFLLLQKPQYLYDVLQKTALAQLLNRKNVFGEIRLTETNSDSTNFELDQNSLIHSDVKLRQQLESLAQAKDYAEKLAIDRQTEIGGLLNRLELTERAKNAAETLALQRLTENEQLNARLTDTERVKNAVETLALERLTENEELAERLNVTERAKDSAETLAFDRYAEVESFAARLRATEEAKQYAEKLALERYAEIENLSAQLNARRESEADLQRTALSLRARLEQVEAAKSSAAELAQERQTTIERLAESLIEVEQAKAAAEKKADEARERLQVIYSSKLWRILQKLK